MNEQNYKKLGAATSENIDKEKMRKAALVKIGAMLILSVILLIFSSMHM